MPIFLAGMITGLLGGATVALSLLLAAGADESKPTPEGARHD